MSNFELLYFVLYTWYKTPRAPHLPAPADLSAVTPPTRALVHDAICSSLSSHRRDDGQGST